MRLLSQLENKSGETFASALLTYILQRSPETRDETLKLIQNAWARGLLRTRHSFSAQTEVSLSDHVNGAGRIDILMTLDNAVIGIEVKFWADFQENQPAKYLPALKEIAEREPTTAQQKAHLLVLLVPQVRRSDAADLLAAQGIRNLTCVVDWEALADRLRMVRTVDPATTFLNEELFHYVQRVVGETRDLSELLPMLTRDLREVDDTTAHKELVGWLWQTFRKASIPTAQTRLGSSHGNWVGTSFAPTLEPHSGWYGFIPTRIIDGCTEDGTAFIVALNKNFPMPQWDSPRIIPIRTNSGWDFDNLHCWRVLLDESLENRQQWEGLLKPLIVQVEEISKQLRM